jgi:4,5-dihydroxyphthalate decarboxylase
MQFTMTVALAHRTTWEIVRRARIPGVTLDIVHDGTTPSNQVYTLLAQKHEWDIGEIAFSTFFMAQDLGSDDIGLPIFSSRMAPHSGLWVRPECGIHESRDLVGKRVGCNSWGTNYSVWTRGILTHQYDVSIQAITWVQSVAEHRGDYALPRRFPIELVPGNLRSEALLAQGRIDAAAMASGSTGPQASAGRALFANPAAELRAYADRWNVVPVNTVLTIKRTVAAQYPELPQMLLDAMTAARSAQRAEAPNVEDAIFQPLERDLGRDLTGYGFAANRPAIREMIAYSYEQGIIRRLYDPEELFVLSDI